MPLGDGTGPPDGSGPMTGRRRLADVCPGVVRKPSSDGPSAIWKVLSVAAAIALVALGIFGEWLARKGRRGER